MSSKQRASSVLSNKQPNFLSNTEGITGFEPPPEQQQLQNHALIGGPPLPGQQQDPVMFVGAAGETGLPEQPACPPSRAEGGVDGDEATALFMDTMHRTQDGNSISKLGGALRNASDHSNVESFV